MVNPHVSGTPGQRLVILGASNVCNGFPTIVTLARALAEGPIDLLAAMGHGRSYGVTSFFLGRSIRGISHCGLWDALDQPMPLPTTALVTDIGNDLLYGLPPTRIVGWVMQCVDRLLTARVSVSITRLPLRNLESVGPGRYRLLRSLFFPRCRLSLKELTQRAHELDELLTSAARQRNVTMTPLACEWYGLDPIHITRRDALVAWNSLLSSSFKKKTLASPERASLGVEWSLRLAPPADRVLFGFMQHSAQPCRQLRDGTRIALY